MQLITFINDCISFFVLSSEGSSIANTIDGKWTLHQIHCPILRKTSLSPFKYLDQSNDWFGIQHGKGIKETKYLADAKSDIRVNSLLLKRNFSYSSVSSVFPSCVFFVWPTFCSGFHGVWSRQRAMNTSFNNLPKKSKHSMHGTLPALEQLLFIFFSFVVPSTNVNIIHWICNP